MNTYYLRRDELDELEQDYFIELKNLYPEVLDYMCISRWQQIPDILIHKHYEGKNFVSNDFACNGSCSNT